MFNRNLLATVLLAVVAMPAFAADDKSTATVSVNSAFVDDGWLVSEDTSLGLDVRFDDVFVDGVFLRGTANSFNLTPVNGSMDFRSDVSVGYAGNIGKTDWEVAVVHNFNDPLYSDDYTEVRGRLTRGIGFVELSQSVSTDVSKNTYAAAGVEKAVTSNVTLGAMASIVRYDDNSLSIRDELQFNNAQVFARYNVWRNLDAQVNYSLGGRDGLDDEVDNQFWGGLSYRF